MSTDISDLMTRNLHHVFSERSPDARAAAMAQLYLDDATFNEAEGVTEGPAAIGERVGKLLADAPGLEFVPAGPVVVVQDRGYLPWQLQPEGGGPVILTGTDVATVVDGRISSLYTFLTSQ